jgi:hypothetical protein
MTPRRLPQRQQQSWPQLGVPGKRTEFILWDASGINLHAGGGGIPRITSLPPTRWDYPRPWICLCGVERGACGISKGSKLPLSMDSATDDTMSQILPMWSSPRRHWHYLVAASSSATDPVDAFRS